MLSHFNFSKLRNLGQYFRGNWHVITSFGSPGGFALLCQNGLQYAHKTSDAQIVSCRDLITQIRDQGPKIDPSAKFQPNWTKDEGS